MKRKLLFAISFLLVSASVFAQGDFRPTEQMFSRINANPSAVGNNENIQIFSATRLQWVEAGLGESPVSTVLNAHYYVEKIKSGFGLSFSYDELGISNQTISAKIVYAYNIDLREDMLLSLGLSAGVINKSFDPNHHEWVDPSDPLNEQSSVTNFDLDFGLELSYKYVLAGFSITHLPNIGKEFESLTAPSHINAYLRGNIPLPKDFSLIPAVSFVNVGAMNKAVVDDVTNNTYQIVEENIMDYGLTAMYQGKYWFGIGYRGGVTENYSNNVAYLMAGFEWHWLRVGYCCDISVDAIDYSTSTHEIMLSFSIPTKKDYVWP